MSVASNYEIALPDFLILISKLRNRKFNPTGICDEGAGLVAVLVVHMKQNQDFSKGHVR